MNWRTRLRLWWLHRRVDRLQRYVEDWQKETVFAARACSHYELLKARTLNQLKALVDKGRRGSLESNLAKRLLAERGPDDVMLIDCPHCFKQSYYNQGFTCGCEHCGRNIADESDDAYTVQDFWDQKYYEGCERELNQTDQAKT